MRIREIAESLVVSKGMELVDMEWHGGRRSVLRVFIAAPGGVTLDDCARVSRELGTLLEAEGFPGGPYTLEVSSPGLNRPLKSHRDFERNIGLSVHLALREGERFRELEGTIRSVTGDSLEVESGSRAVRINLSAIELAKLKIEC